MFGKAFQRKQQPITDFNASLGANDINLTPTAATKMEALMADAAEESMAAIRVFVMGGGCGGMTYGMTYADTITPYDTVLSGNGYQIAIDAIALNYLRGCTIDYVKQGLNESFVFKDVFQSVGGSGGCSGCAAAGSTNY